MSEGRQNEGDETGQPAGKVVRLPRDWLGPREELIPFGRPPQPPQAPEHPASAADFWGEDSAAFHDALQATEDPLEPKPTLTTGVAAAGRRRLALATAMAVAAAAIAALASGGFGLRASPSRPAPGAKVSVAAVLSSGVSRVLQGITIVGASASRVHSTAAAPPRARVARRTAHPRRVFQPVHASPRRQPSAPVSHSTPVSADVVRTVPTESTSTATGGGTSEASITPTRHQSSPATSRTPHPSGATVSPTGESGALGPIQSPNG